MNSLTQYILSRFGGSLSRISERKDFHPEPSVLHHILIVADRVKSDRDLYVAALYHDLGKIFTYQLNGNSHGHELSSAWLLMEDRELLENFYDINFDKVYFIVKNHMRAHVILEDKPYNSEDFEIMRNKYFPDLKRFAKADDMLNTKFVG